jgi:CRISPR-associated endonuclease Csy4
VGNYVFAISEIDLQKLDIRKWLDRLLDYTHITSIRPVPESRVTGYAIYKRKQVKLIHSLPSSCEAW